MTLVQCPECARTISHMATACPGCGYPFDAPDASGVSELAREPEGMLCVRCGETLSAEQCDTPGLCMACCDECY